MLYEVAITTKKRTNTNTGEVLIAESIVVKPTCYVAESTQEANIQAGIENRHVLLNDLNTYEFHCRPFGSGK